MVRSPCHHPNRLNYCVVRSVSRTLQLELSLHTVRNLHMTGIALQIFSFCPHDQYLYAPEAFLPFAVRNRGPGRSINLSSFSSDNPGTQVNSNTLFVFPDSVVQTALQVSTSPLLTMTVVICLPKKRIAYLGTICLQLCMPACWSIEDYFDYSDPGPLQQIQDWTFKSDPNLPSICSPRLLALFTSAWD